MDSLLVRLDIDTYIPPCLSSFMHNEGEATVAED